MKGILEFNLPEEREEFELAQKGGNYKIALDEVWEKVFRPFYKHGYPDSRIGEILDKLDDADQVELIDRLSRIYHDIISDLED